MTDTKIRCLLCRLMLPEDAFSKGSRSVYRNGCQSHCKKCYRVYRRDLRTWQHAQADQAASDA